MEGIKLAEGDARCFVLRRGVEGDGVPPCSCNRLTWELDKPVLAGPEKLCKGLETCDVESARSLERNSSSPPDNSILLSVSESNSSPPSTVSWSSRTNRPRKSTSYLRASFS